MYESVKTTTLEIQTNSVVYIKRLISQDRLEELKDIWYYYLIIVIAYVY